jgi:gas vesicle protein
MTIASYNRRKESETMKTNGETKFSYFLVGLGLGAIGGLISALLARKDTRDLLRERSAKSLEYLNQQGNNLRKTTEGILGKGKAMLSQGCCSSESTAGSETRAQEEAKSEL